MNQTNNNTQHTPGLTAHKAFHASAFEIKQGETRVATVYQYDEKGNLIADFDEVQNMANLFASAPDMLEAGKNVVPYMQMIKQNYPEMVGLIAGLEDMQTAISKATGNQ